MAFDKFLWFAIGADGRDRTTLLSFALVHYRDALGGAEPPVDLPAFLAAPAHSREVEVPLAPALEGLLRREAERLQVAVERVLSHAVFVYMADHDRLAGPSEAR
jgi:hypothetical protein